MYGRALDTSGNKPSTPRDAERGSADQQDKARPTSPGRASDLDASRSAASAQANWSAIASLRQALQTLPDIAELSKNIVIEPTKEGVNVSLVDEDGRSMFRDNAVEPYERTRRVLEAIAPTLRRLPNGLTITGHTSTVRPGSAGSAEPWNLTAGRALAVREILSGAGVPNDHFTSVVGRADTEPVFPDNPYIAPNRRVTITCSTRARRCRRTFFADDTPPRPAGAAAGRRGPGGGTQSPGTGRRGSLTDAALPRHVGLPCPSGAIPADPLADGTCLERP